MVFFLHEQIVEAFFRLWLLKMVIMILITTILWAAARIVVRMLIRGFKIIDRPEQGIHEWNFTTKNLQSLKSLI